ncbi:MAG: hypothetical protein QOE70_6431 [Chthoniobacter sp.]|jgi:predicted SAM-dependent methyltransferase|nr:hypothetical protein [Chthoniobacter sp.]
MNAKYAAKWCFCKLRQWVQGVPQASTSDGKLNLHLGCGIVNSPGFVNIDAMPMRHVHCVQPVDRLQKFRSGCADLIYASHVLEHISHRETLNVLREWRRVLKTGGVLRLAVPDFDVISRLYQDGGCDVAVVEGVLLGGQDYAYNYHKAVFTERSLTRLLAQAGFTQVRRWTYGSSPMTSLNDHSALILTHLGQSYPISLNLEAVNGGD